MKIGELFRRILSKCIHLTVQNLTKMLTRKGVVYMFHSIGDDKHDFNLTTASFEVFLQKLKGRNVVRLENWHEECNNFVCLTFDDVADSFYYNAFPLLKKYKLPFTIFISCSLLNKKGHITEKMLREIASCDLCTVGSHGWKHVFYKDFDSKEAELDLSESKKFLEKIAERDVNLYAFPYGSIYACGIGGKKLVSAYYKYGFGTISTSITSPSLLPYYYLPRNGVHNGNFEMRYKEL